MEFASFRLRSQGTCSRINQCQHTILTLREEESMRDGGRERMLTAFKTPMGILCHCILSPLLLASTISRHSVCVCVSQASQSGSVTLCCFSSWLLLSSFHHPFLSHSVFYPTFPLLSNSSSHFLLFFLSSYLLCHSFLSGFLLC